MTITDSDEVYADRIIRVNLEMDGLGPRLQPQFGGGLAWRTTAGGIPVRSSRSGHGGRGVDASMRGLLDTAVAGISRPSERYEATVAAARELPHVVVEQLRELLEPHDSLSLRLRSRDWGIASRRAGPTAGSAATAQIVWRRRLGTAGRAEATWSGQPSGLEGQEVTAELRAQMDAATRHARQSTRRPASGATTFVLSPRAATALIHEVIGHALEGDRVVQGSRLWNERRALRLSPLLTIEERAGDAGAWEPATHDDEGIPVQPLPLVTAGRVRSAMTDTTTAARLGHRCTGHGRRESYASAVVPRMRHTVLHDLPQPTEAPVTQVSDGILVESVDGGQADALAGSFALRVSRSRRIVNGLTNERLAPFLLTGDLTALDRVTALGADARTTRFYCGKAGVWLATSGRCPTVVIEGLQVA